MTAKTAPPAKPPPEFPSKALQLEIAAKNFPGIETLKTRSSDSRFQRGAVGRAAITWRSRLSLLRVFSVSMPGKFLAAISNCRAF